MGLRFLALLMGLATASVAYRLPQTVVPSSYVIHLNLPEDVFTADSNKYTGTVIITIRVQRPTRQIQLHAAHDFINIDVAHINSNEITNISVDNSTDIVTLDLGGILAVNSQHSLSFDFTSRLSTTDMYGFYKSSYTNNGTTKYIATTQFQPVFARRAFPCFDEPAFKAVFTIYVTKPIGMNVLSNMPGEFHDTSDIIGNDPKLDTMLFSQSGIMPSYLVAIVVSDFTCTEGDNIETNAVAYKVCSRNETASSRTFAVDIGPPLLRSLNNFTNFPYGSLGFPKMEQVAIPDFAAGAMENWGLTTYREGLLLWDPNESTARDQQTIATVISHEFGHMWWGNLVTMNWWSEVFLNEGFATYFEYFTADDVRRSWELEKQFVVNVLQTALADDVLEASQALQAPANSDAEVLLRFSQISYLKGGSIFRMVEHILGKENFIAGLRSYLQKYQYKNTLPEDLWNTLDAQLPENDRSRLPSSISLAQVMQNWVTTPGYPLIDVALVDNSVIITQEGRFLLNGEKNKARWYVPISYSTFRNPQYQNTFAQEWLQPVGSVEIPFVLGGWIVLNNLATGYYRVNYNNMWERLALALRTTNFGGIPDVNRASLVDDAFYLGRTDKLNYTRVFNIIDFLKNDESHHAWVPALNGFNFLLRRVGEDSLVGSRIKNHSLSLLSTIYSSVPWTSLNEEDHAYTLKQVDVLSSACRWGLSICVNHATERFTEFKITQTRPRPNLRSVVYCNALRYSTGQSDWIILWDSYETAEAANEKVLILNALGCTQDERTLEHYLQLSLTENSGIRPQDALTVFRSVYSGSTVGIDLAFKFLIENYQLIEQRYQSLNALATMITGLAERFTTQEQIDKLKDFLTTDNLQEDFKIAANNALQIAENNLAWLKKNEVELFTYYGLNPDGSETTTTSTTTEKPGGGGASATVSSMVLVVLSIIVALRY